MAVTSLTIDFPGVNVLDSSEPQSLNFPFGVCYMLGSATKGASHVLTKITSVDSFKTIFGDTSDSEKYVQAFFDNLTNNADLYFYRVNAGEAAASVPAVHADYKAALGAIDPTAHPGGILIMPEYFSVATFTDANKKELAGLIDKFCSTDDQSYWICYADLAIDTVQANYATAKNNIFSLTTGNIAVYAPYYVIEGPTDDPADDVKLVPSAAMAAISLSLWASGEYFLAPAGLDMKIKNVKELGWNLNKAELTEFHKSGINAIRYFAAFDAYVPYDSITVSNTTVEYYQINSVVCFKIVAYLLYREVLPLIHSALRGTAEVLTAIEGAINRVLYDAWQAGYLVGRTSNEAFDVKNSIQTLPAPNAAILEFYCAVRPAYAIQKITIHLKNMLGTKL